MPRAHQLSAETTRHASRHGALHRSVGPPTAQRNDTPERAVLAGVPAASLEAADLAIAIQPRKYGAADTPFDPPVVARMRTPDDLAPTDGLFARAVLLHDNRRYELAALTGGITIASSVDMHTSAMNYAQRPGRMCHRERPGLVVLRLWHPYSTRPATTGSPSTSTRSRPQAATCLATAFTKPFVIWPRPDVIHQPLCVSPPRSPGPPTPRAPRACQCFSANCVGCVCRAAYSSQHALIALNYFASQDYDTEPNVEAAEISYAWMAAVAFAEFAIARDGY